MRNDVGSEEDLTGTFRFDLPPGWIRAETAQDADQARFLAGAALASLHPVGMGRAAVPMALLCDRMALLAAEASLRLMGRPAGLAALRDAVHLIRPGEHSDPAGGVAQAWRRAARQQLEPGTGETAPLAAAATAYEDSRADHPGDLPGALMAAEAALAGALGWPSLLPVLTLGFSRRDLALCGADLELACARAVVTSAPRAQRLAGDLTRRAAKLRAVAPKLRAKAAPAALDLLLKVDALTPALALSPVVQGSVARMSDRAARRFCDRLAGLGVLREFSGRAAFRIYGL
ncbi:DUF1403 family protein (plasmid) [Paracoccus saliphilus]|nr:DUF1403 family protein [Paracoccus saliphilus]